MTTKTKQRINRILLWVLIVLMAVWMLFPFYWAINSSFKSEGMLAMTPTTFVPRDPVTREVSLFTRNYEAVFTNQAFLRGIVNSVVVATSVTLLSLAIGSFAGFALGKLRYRGKTATLYIILAMTMFPAIAVLTGLYAMINNLGIPPIPSMIITYMLFTLPFTAWVLTAFFRELPTEIFQSAQVDGASPFQTFYLIMLPLTAPALVTTGLLAFIGAWNEYLFALTFTSIAPDARTLPVIIANFPSQFSRQIPFGEIMAGGIISSVPLIVLVFIFQRRIVAGLTAGAVKG
ncbi:MULTISPECIES: carbohydrate ABC transporter permease [Caldilinea]|jgi:trehalose/maltose transport system permease protein|uniref:Putative ABC transporter permease protein n=1 Tax=Caldilinea aerophila (strain DSM 14535 / JCM 11387 / NBRC 104270 / STL-6-O1) TaxID=926550 RepID=I0I602_CALAS|nr:MULTISPECIES: carbohydrate ABC transporter permease [Caldilinea]MBO9392701.1 carbohydrate ABC transporter permease [Caldilinea sp.]BAM00690.1 putative ABC transporter permease protein [Caldilinea aerophila DSM 14535 = NBRC 104270]GIV72033.1 MAG: ABC transporter permease [Caldilinea sp.]